MPLRIGHFEPLQLIFGIMDILMRKGYLSYEEARQILSEALPSDMPVKEKENLLNSLIKRIDTEQGRRLEE